MSLTRKERMHRAITYKEVDRIPTQINYSPGMGQNMSDYFNIPVEDLPAFLGNHMIRVDTEFPGVLSKDGKVKFDWWGVGFDTQEEGYFAAVSPLAENNDLDSYPWPDPNDPNLLLGAEKTIKEKGAAYFITPNFGFVLFERAWTLRGFEQFFMDMATDPGFKGMITAIAEVGQLFEEGEFFEPEMLIPQVIAMSALLTTTMPKMV